MQKFKLLAGAMLAATALSGCMANNDLDRAAIGAGAGLVGAAVIGGNLALGAGAGALAGAVCDDVGVCR